MSNKVIDPNSPVPLYHQIAEAIRLQIEDGELARGDALAPMREAAQIWGVNLHTVRHAYTALARDGLVKSRGAQGTWVTAESTKKPAVDTNSFRQFIGRIIKEAQTDHQVAPRELAREISAYSQHVAENTPVVYVVECSTWQSENHAREIEAQWAVEARAWSLEQDNEPPSGAIVATYFHYNDIRRRWPHRLHEVQFVNIVPDATLVHRLPDDTRRVQLCERDQVTAENLTADLSSLLATKDYEIEPLVSADINSVIAENDQQSILLIAPRTWASLSKQSQANPRVFAANYVINTGDLDILGKKLGWATSNDTHFESDEV
ncbi:MAG: GntR family transcriptional regulator [bacterium]|nr:GntR family transcriptional regulator [bacterium]